MSINGRRPFTEMVEVAQAELVREAASNQREKYKGFVNQVYLNDLKEILPEEFIKKEAFITVVSQYTTGTVTIGTGTVGAIGSGTLFTSAMTDWFLKVSGFNRVNRVTYSADTLVTFQNSLSWVEGSGTGLSYTLAQDRYALPSDFAYMIADDPEDPNVVSTFINGVPLYMIPLSNDEYNRMFNGITGIMHSYTVKWISETPYLSVIFAPDSLDIVRYEYIPQLTTLTEYTTGTVTFANSTAVVGAGGMLWSANLSTANTYYIRNDTDGTGSGSKWTKIASVANATALTLSAAFGGTTGAAQTYTISEVSKWPARFDDAIVYKTALLVDPDGAQSKKWASMYEEKTQMDRASDARRKTVRPMKQFFGMRKRS